MRDETVGNKHRCLCHLTDGKPATNYFQLVSKNALSIQSVAFQLRG
jgi:hypothetical protein